MLATDSLDGDGDQDPIPLRLKNGSVCFGMICSTDFVVSLIKVCQKGGFDSIVLEIPRLFKAPDPVSTVDSLFFQRRLIC